MMLWETIQKSFKTQIWWSIGMFAGTIILHSVFLVYFNEGWKSGPWNGYLVTINSWVSATLTWTVVSSMLFLLVRKTIEKGFTKTLVDILSTPLSWSRSVEQTGIVFANILLLFSASATILLSSQLYSVADLALTLWFIVSVGSGIISSGVMFLYLLSNSLSKGKLEGYFSLPTCLNVLSLIFLGGAFGFLLGFLIEKDLYLAIGLSILAGYLVYKRKSIKESSILTSLLIITSYLIWKKHVAFADDGGWDEAGSTLTGWLRSDGAFKIIQFSLWPALGTALAPPATDNTLKFGEELKKQLKIYNKSPWDINQTQKTLFLESEIWKESFKNGSELLGKIEGESETDGISFHHTRRIEIKEYSDELLQIASLTDVEKMALITNKIASYYELETSKITKSVAEHHLRKFFVSDMEYIFTGRSGILEQGFGGKTNKEYFSGMDTFRATGFRDQYVHDPKNENQVFHAMGGISAGYYLGETGGNIASNLHERGSLEDWNLVIGNRSGESYEDLALSYAAVPIGLKIAGDEPLSNIGRLILMTFSK